MDINEVVELGEAPFRLDIIDTGTVRFSEVEGLEERFPDGYELIEYVPHLIHCGDLVIRNGQFVRTPQMMQWLNKQNIFNDDKRNVVVTLLGLKGEDYYIWRFYDAQPYSIVFDDSTLKEPIVKIKYLSFKHRGLIREK